MTVGIREDDDDEPDPAGALPTSLSMPVRATDQKPSPPQSAVSYPWQGLLQLEFEATELVGGSRSPQ